MMTKQIVTVLGGTGQQGGGVVDALLGAGKFAVRVVSRNPAGDTARALAARRVEVVKADLLDPSSLRSALKGSHGAFVVTNAWDPAQGPREAEIATAAVQAARAAGVEQLIWARRARTRAANLGVERRRRHDSAAPVGAIRPTKRKQLGEDAVLDVETAEFVDAPVQQTQPGGHQLENMVTGVRVPVYGLAEDPGRHTRR